MAKVLVLYYSSWGHMEQMANAAAEGALSAGATVTVKRVRNSCRMRSPRPITTSSIKPLRSSPIRTSLPIMTPSSSARPLATA